MFNIFQSLHRPSILTFVRTSFQAELPAIPPKRVGDLC